MQYVLSAYVMATTLLIISTFVFVRTWWARVLWLAAIAGSIALGYFGLAVQVLMIIVMAVKEVLMRIQAGESERFHFEEESGKVIATSEQTGQMVVYSTTDQMPLHVHSQYLASRNNRPQP